MAETPVYTKATELAQIFWTMMEVGKPDKKVRLPTSQIPLQVFESMLNRKSLHFKHRTGSKMYLFELEPLTHQVDYTTYTEDSLRATLFDNKGEDDAETRRKRGHLHEALDLSHGVRKRLTMVGGHPESKAAEKALEELAAAIRKSIVGISEEGRRFDAYRRVINIIRRELDELKYSVMAHDK